MFSASHQNYNLSCLWLSSNSWLTVSDIRRIYCSICLPNFVLYSKVAGCQSCVNNRFTFSPFLTSLVTLSTPTFTGCCQASKHTWHLSWVCKSDQFCGENFIIWCNFDLQNCDNKEWHWTGQHLQILRRCFIAIWIFFMSRKVWMKTWRCASLKKYHLFCGNCD